MVKRKDAIPIKNQKKDCARCRWEQSIERQNVRIIGYVVNIIISSATTALVLWLTGHL